MARVFLICVIIIMIVIIVGYFWYKVMFKHEDIEHLAPAEAELEEKSDSDSSLLEDVPTPEESAEAEIIPREIVEQQPASLQFQAGMNLLIYGHPHEQQAEKLFRSLSQLGVNSVAIVFPLFQEGWQASQVKSDPKLTPTKQELKNVIRAAQKEGLSVMLRPILDEQSIMKSGRWRGNIQPENIDLWFESYRLLLLEYAQIAQTTRVNYLNIGTEFNSLQKNGYSEKWIQMISEIREVYEGKLIYSFNWDSVSDILESEFVPHLDYVGIDAYFPLEAPDQASVLMLEESWEQWSPDIEKLLSDKPIIVTEAGIIPVTGAYRTPYAWEISGGVYEPEAQANYYEATYKFWSPMSVGIYWWAVTLEPSNFQTINYSPLRSPTKSVLREMFKD